MSAIAALQIGLALLPLVTTGVTEFIAWLNSLKTAAQQAGEWTPEQDAAFTAAILAKNNDPAYQP
jgi:hypothetical protein